MLVPLARKTSSVPSLELPLPAGFRQDSGLAAQAEVRGFRSFFGLVAHVDGCIAYATGIDPKWAHPQHGRWVDALRRSGYSIRVTRSASACGPAVPCADKHWRDFHITRGSFSNAYVTYLEDYEN